MPEITVREATVADAATLARIHVQSWREAYVDIFPAAFLAQLDVERRTAGWTAILTDGVTSAFVAFADGEPVGWVTAGARSLDSEQRALELEGIYVLARAHGSGAGQLLLDAAVGTAPAYLWMADPNPRAEAFYTRNGFRRDGTSARRRFGSAEVETVRLLR